MLFFVECSKVELLQEETRNLKENNAPKDKAPMKELPEVLFFSLQFNFSFQLCIACAQIILSG